MATGVDICVERGIWGAMHLQATADQENKSLRVFGWQAGNTCKYLQTKAREIQVNTGYMRVGKGSK